MQAFDAFLLAVVVVYTAVCLVTDLRWRRIPNWLTVPSLVLGLAVHAVRGGWAGLQFSLLGFATGFGVLFVLWLIGGGGGGDVKMMGALGAWLGSTLTFVVFVASALVTLVLMGGLMTYAAMSEGVASVRRRYPAKTAASKAATAKGHRPGRILPYAVPLAVSAWIVLGLAWWRYGTLAF